MSIRLTIKKCFLWMIMIVTISGCDNIRSQVIVGAERLDQYIDLISNRKIGLVVNHSSTFKGSHLVDTLFSLSNSPDRIFTPGTDIRKVFTPEHGYRGDISDGILIKNDIDSATGIPMESLYNENKKPSKASMADIELMIFDIQDVGVRCYTYISTLHNIMEACAENGVPLLVLDRPNPNGFYVDGPILDTNYRSFVGMHPVPLVYGMTIGEYAMMINGEGWLTGGIECDLTVIPCNNYDHNTRYNPPVKPSPNLPNLVSIYLYPSLVLFEGTDVSIGRGTEFPFQVFGHPDFREQEFSFVPRSMPGKSAYPLHEEDTCYGVDLRDIPNGFLQDNAQVILDWILEAYELHPNKELFFSDYFTNITGSIELEAQIKAGWDKFRIMAHWEESIGDFMKVRKRYLLYRDFE